MKVRHPHASMCARGDNSIKGNIKSAVLPIFPNLTSSSVTVMPSEWDKSNHYFNKHEGPADTRMKKCYKACRVRGDCGGQSCSSMRWAVVGSKFS